jgi:5-oxoprolinase (ATP-hydrolysing)
MITKHVAATGRVAPFLTTGDLSVHDVHRVWVDVGGTFTDCFVTDPDGNQRVGKVLSSGLVKGSVGIASNRNTVIDADGRREPDGFWIGAQLQVESRDGDIMSSRVVGYTAADGALQLQSPLSDAPKAGSMYQLDTGLEAPILATRMLLGIGLAAPLPPLDVRMGTTRGTNALLTRTGADVALVITKGFGDTLEIGTQERPRLFELDIRKPEPLTRRVLEVDHRLAADGTVLIDIDPQQIRDGLRRLHDAGVESLAICLLNAYQHNQHERLIELIAREIGFRQISISSDVAPLIKLVSRAETTTLDAYLNPILREYLDTVWKQFGGRETSRLRLMTSGGQLVDANDFRGRDSVLSGPAGGVVALASVGEMMRNGPLATRGVIGFDMGGTSTDVSRYEGQLVKQLESRKAGVRMMTPMMAIHTVAAGGGSVCHVDLGRLFVGPSSAGSLPGPACYGNGGPLTVTDLNLVLGRLIADRFPFQLDTEAARVGLTQAQVELAEAGVSFESLESLAEGFWRIAVNHMAEAIRTVTIAEGSDPRTMTLVSFGGAAGQHACAVANTLGIKTIFDHPHSSMFSALGMGLAPVGRFASRGVYRKLSGCDDETIAGIVQELSDQAENDLASDIASDSRFDRLATVELRYVGTEGTLPIEFAASPPWSAKRLETAFSERHRQSFGFVDPQREIELVTVRVDVQIESEHNIAQSFPRQTHRRGSERSVPLFTDGQWISAQFFDRESLEPGCLVDGPAVIAGTHGTMVVDPGWNCMVCGDNSLVIQVDDDTDSIPEKTASAVIEQTSDAAEAIELELVARRLEAIAEQMGEVLRRTAVSVNVKERLDYSCAIFDRQGVLVAGAMHVPVHLGAMGHTVRGMIEKYPTMYPGDSYVSNNPYAGGSHLPDVTVVAPVFVRDGADVPDYYVASRAHHAEIGGITPGSMPPEAVRLEQEGVILDNLPLVRNGRSFSDAVRNLLETAPYPSRNPDENLADLAAQVAAGRRGASDLVQLAEQAGIDALDRRMTRLLDLAAESLAPILARFRDQAHRFTDLLIPDCPITVSLQSHGDRLRVDFSGTAPTHPRGWNATPAIVSAALLYVLRCLSDRPLPLCEGVLRHIDLHIPPGLLNPTAADPLGKSPAVVAGNVETSQRIVDTLLGAIGVAAASQGTMNNLLIGDDRFGYYETICGGAGATMTGDGASAVHTHMTNTRITDPEILEARYPLRLWRFAIRPHSGGAGQHSGGNGVIRDIEILRPLTVSMISSRCGENSPYGLHGGQPGKPGQNRLQRRGDWLELPASFTLQCIADDRLCIETPGGGGWSKKDG